MPWGREEDFKRNYVISLYNLCGHKLAQELLPHWVAPATIKFKILPLIEYEKMMDETAKLKL